MLGIMKIAAFISVGVVATGISATAAEIVFLCGNPLQAAVQELIPEFEKTSGHKVRVMFANLGTNTERVRKGEEADLAIVSPAQWESLQKEGRLAPGPRVVVGKIGFGVFVKKGAPRPDISSVDAFKRAILNARSIVIGDPARGSQVGAYVIPLFDRLGIGDDARSKLRLTADGPAALQAVAKGEADLGFTQMTEILAVPDVVSVGPIPNEIQNFTTLTAAIPANAKQAAAAKVLIEFLTSPRAVSVFKSKGLEGG